MYDRATPGAGTPHLTFSSPRAISIRGQASPTTCKKPGFSCMTAKRVFPLLLSATALRPAAVFTVCLVLGLAAQRDGMAAPAAGGACAPFTKGQAALEQRDLPQAAANFRKAVSDSCEASEARRRLGELAWRQQRPEQAEAEYRAAIDWDLRHGGKERACDYVALALMQLRQNKVADAAKTLQRADVLDGAAWCTTYGRARLCLANQEWEGAITLLGRYPKGPDGADAIGEYYTAMAMYHVGVANLAEAEGEALRSVSADITDPERLALFHKICKGRGTTSVAITALEQAKAEANKTAPASLLTELGRMYQTGRRYNEARDMYVKAVAADSNFAPALLDLGDLMRLAKKPEVAAQLYLRYLGQMPRDVDAMLHITQACLDIGQIEQAATTAADAMKVNPSRPDVRRNFARAGLRSNDPEMSKAAQTVFNGMANDPTWTADDWLLLAEYHRDGNNFEAAKDATAHAATFDPASPAVEYERGLIEMSAGNTAQAITHLQAAVNAKPDAPSYHLNLGVALIKADRKGDGLASMRRALAVNPQYTQGHLALAQSLAAVDSVQAANAQYQAILAYDPTNGAALCGLGWAAVRAADCKEANRLFKSVVDSNPKNAEAWAGLGSAEVCASNLPAAKVALDRAAQIEPNDVNVKRGQDLLARARSGSGQ